MAAYESLDEVTDLNRSINKGVSFGSAPLQHPSITKLSMPNSLERRRSSFGVFTRTVLCAVDLSSCSRNAFEYYLLNMWKNDDLIVLVYIPEVPYLPSFSFKRGLAPPVDDWKSAMEDANKKTQSLESEYEAICVQRKLRYKIRGESYKNAGEGICKIAEEERADLIVMGTRGMGAVKRALIGSVSEFVIRNAITPCLIIPSK